MNQGTFRRFKRLIEQCGFYRRRGAQVHSDGAILAVYFWAALSDRAVCWACDRRNWPAGLWRGELPSQSCMSRRMNTACFRAQLQRIEQLARPPITPITQVTVDAPTSSTASCSPDFCFAHRELSTEPIVLLACLDAKPLVIAWHSTDPHAGKGRGAGTLARGYKLHALVSASGHLLAWRLASLNVDERTIAARLLRDVRNVCYVVADANYNSSPLFRIAQTSGSQLVAPRKLSHQGKGLGNHEQHEHRLRSIELLEDGLEPFARDMLVARRSIERFFANLTNFGGGLTCLPAWVRTYPRVLAWTTAKLTIAHLRNAMRQTMAA